MGTFDIKLDAPGLLRVESLNITLKFDRTGPNTGRVSWNIPTPATGCGADEQAYCGIIVTLDTTPISGSKVPIDNTVYSSDPNGNSNLFAGDKLGTSFIIGAFYGDRTTTYFDITGLTPNTPYYISGFPVDCQYRYFKEGVHAYSLDYTNRGTEGTHGTQLVILKSNVTPPGVSPNDFTGLQPSINYDFQIQLGVVPTPRTPLDPYYVNPAPITYTIQIAGSNSENYTDLVNEINKNLSLIDITTQGPLAPNTGAFYWDSSANKLYQWDGTHNVEIPVIIQATAPDIVTTGTYWLYPTTNVLKHWNGTTWITDTVITSIIDPQVPIADQSYWFDGTNGYVWNGTTWCKTLIFDQALDPSTIAPTTNGAYWYDPSTNIMYKWDNSVGMWIVTDIIQYHEDPNALTVGSYWFDETTNSLNAWNIPLAGWNIQTNLFIGEREPAIPVAGQYWYNPATQVLKRYDGVNSVWVEYEVISFPYDPTQRAFCDTWWNTLQDKLYTWDNLNFVWKLVTTFYEQSTDPSLLPSISNGTLWYNSTTQLLYVWKNNCFTLVNFISYPTDPTTTLAIGTVWYYPITNTWKELNGSRVWVSFIPIISVNDPNSLPIGSYWYNTTNSSVQVWNGAAWVSILFSTTSPAPVTDSKWFNTTTNQLLMWNGIYWVTAPVRATAELDAHGNLLFTDSNVSGLSFVNLIDGTLFKSLSVPYTFYDPKPGSDGISDIPSYNEIGIGTDGSDDQRLLLMTEIRYELGYPSIDVELTNEQLDYAITKALSELRQKSSLGYKRGFFFMQTSPETQRYLLNNKTGEFNKIVDIMGIYRLTSSFLASAHGAGVYGQIVLQHLYNMGTFDLLSYHIMVEYTKTMEQLFAARLTFTWNEQQRELWIHHRFPFTEPYVAVEASMERTEQDILSDRYSRPWIRRYSAAVCRLILAEIRGKFSTLPGASGSITLNANDLRMAAKEEMEACLAEIFDFVADKPEEYGMATTFIFG